MLITDTNIFVRCSRGVALARVLALRHRGVHLATTDRNVLELLDCLIRKFGLAEPDAAIEVSRVLAPFEIIHREDYDHLRDNAWARLRDGGKTDWPVLAAALALGGEIWSEDVDFFGVGVPIWSTENVRFVAPTS